MFWGLFCILNNLTPNTSYSDHEGLSNYPYILEITLPIKTSPPCPFKRRLTVLYISLLGQRQQWNWVGTAGWPCWERRGSAVEDRKGGDIWGERKGSTNPAFGKPDGAGQGINCLPSCSCCIQICWSGASVEWRHSDCVAQSHSEKGNNWSVKDSSYFNKNNIKLWEKIKNYIYIY